MLSAPHRLRRSADFTLTVRKGARAGRSNLVVHCLLRDIDEPVRVGFTVGAGVGNSVVRHRISRQLREIVKPLLNSVPAGTNIVVRALPGAATCGHEALVAEVTGGLATALKKSHLMKQGWQALLWLWDHSLGFVLKWVLIVLIRAYQLTLSKLLMPSCRFHPSCSAYALGCVYEHGAIKGTALSVWRLMRCNPWNGGGLDPVPEHGYWRPAILSDGGSRVDASHEHKN